MKCPVSLQGVAAEAAAWGASRVARCSWPSKSSTDLLPSSSSSWPCWRRSVSINLPRAFSSAQSGFHSSGKAAEIPAVTCATSPTRLWSRWLNSCSQHSADLLANSTGSCWREEERGRHGGRGRETPLPDQFQRLRIKRICSCTFYLAAAHHQQMLFASTWHFIGSESCKSPPFTTISGIPEQGASERARTCALVEA